MWLQIWKLECKLYGSKPFGPRHQLRHNATLKITLYIHPYDRLREQALMRLGNEWEYGNNFWWLYMTKEYLNKNLLKIVD